MSDKIVSNEGSRSHKLTKDNLTSYKVGDKDGGVALIHVEHLFTNAGPYKHFQGCIISEGNMCMTVVPNSQAHKALESNMEKYDNNVVYVEFYVEEFFEVPTACIYTLETSNRFTKEEFEKKGGKKGCMKKSLPKILNPTK